MKKFLACLGIGFAVFCSGAEKIPASIKIPEVIVPFGNEPQEKTVSFAKVPKIKGYVAVLKARIFNKYSMPAGWNNSNRFYINGKRLDFRTLDGDKRLLYRGDALKFGRGSRAWFLNNGWLVYFCDGQKIDKRITAPIEAKCWYFFDVSDVLYDTKENSFKAVTLNQQKMFKKTISLCVTDVEIVYLPEKDISAARTKK